jgi:hypothetical protein
MRDLRYSSMYTPRKMLRETSVYGERLPAGWVLTIHYDNHKWPIRAEYDRICPDV